MKNQNHPISMAQPNNPPNVIDLLESSDDDSDGGICEAIRKEKSVFESVHFKRNNNMKINSNNPRIHTYNKRGNNAPNLKNCSTAISSKDSESKQTKKRKNNNVTQPCRKLQAGVVVYEDTAVKGDNENFVKKYEQEQHNYEQQGKATMLFHDPDFETLPSSIEGAKIATKKSAVTCRCKGAQSAKLVYRKTDGKPYYCCSTKRCRFFKWAFAAEKLHWYRFGTHSGHMIVSNQFSANDLCQGRVGDCWFLSALAVVAERPDLIMRLFGDGKFSNHISKYGIVQLQLFIDGYWKTIVIDNFLPCLIDDTFEKTLQQTLLESDSSTSSNPKKIYSQKFTIQRYRDKNDETSVSGNDPFAISDKCRRVLNETHEFLCQDQARKNMKTNLNINAYPSIIRRPATSEDLAYSKAKKNQLWVPFLEKAYAKSHGSYQAISGGHIAEAFLDLTGAPTVSYIFDSKNFEPRSFWHKLMRYRKQRLPMGCATSSSAAGIIGMHAYSILDVKEVKNVNYSFFLETGVAHGNVSGFTEYDGTVRLLRIRNPHGKGEWRGDFSDKSKIWEKLVQHKEPDFYNDTAMNHRKENSELTRTMKNDGTFWIDYDNFLMAFYNVDVVLAFLGNHAKSFTSNFPPKKSNHRCFRAFEVSLLSKEKIGDAYKDTVELYIMGIQKTRRGAMRGRSDRKRSYKTCDLGILVGENVDEGISNYSKTLGKDDAKMEFTRVRGKMLGFSKNGHYRLALNYRKNKKVTIMPISFGHPAATDKELSFVLRFVSDSPVFIRELRNIPPMDTVIQKFCLSPQLDQNETKQGLQKVILRNNFYSLIQINCIGGGGDTIFVYLCLNENKLLGKQSHLYGLSFMMEATARGMSCRTEDGLLQHETVAKGQKFEASWRKFTSTFTGEKRSRLLAVLFRSGQDFEFGSIECKEIPVESKSSFWPKKKSSQLSNKSVQQDREEDRYEERGIFNSVPGGNHTYITTDPIVSIPTELGLYHETELENSLLNQAIVASCKDLELERALELSKLEAKKNQYQSTFDTDLERVIQLSKADKEFDSERIEAQSCTSIKSMIAISSERKENQDLSNDDINLKRAIELSIREAKSLHEHAQPKISFFVKDENGAISSAPINSRESNSSNLKKENDSPKEGNGKTLDIHQPEQLTKGGGIEKMVTPAKRFLGVDKRTLAAEAALKRMRRK